MKSPISLAAGRPVRARSNWCPICRKRFENDEYEIHVEKEHVFSMIKPGVKNSMRKNKPSSDFKESQMTKKFNEKKTHLNISQLIKKQKIAKANHFFKSRKKTKLNEKSSLVIRPKCGIQCRAEKSLKAHLLTTHTQFNKSAHSLQTKATLNTLTEKHVKSIQGKIMIQNIPLLKCPHCSTRRWGEQRLKRHIMIMHRKFLREKSAKSVKRKSLMQQQIFPFKCPLCGLNCWGEHRLKTHLVIVHRQFLGKSPSTVQFKVTEQCDKSVKRKILIQKSAVLTCPECGIQRFGEQRLKSHILMVHKESLAKSFCAFQSVVPLEKSTEQCVKSDTRNISMQEKPLLMCSLCGILRWGVQRLKTHVILAHRKLLRKSSGMLQTNTALESLTKQSVKSLKKRSLMLKTLHVVCPQCGIQRLGEKRFKTHKVIAHRELLRRCLATIPKNPHFMCSKCLVIRNGDQRFKTHVFMAHRELLKQSAESTEYHESYRDFKVIVFKDYITYAQNLFIQRRIFHSTVAILGLEGAISFCRKYFFDMFDCDPKLAEATRKLILLAGIKGDIDNSIQNLIGDLIKKNPELAGTSDNNLSANNNEKTTNFSQNTFRGLFNENPESAGTSDKSYFVYDEKTPTNISQNPLRGLCKKNPESAETSDKNLLNNDEEKITNLCQNSLELFNENFETRDENMFVNTKEKNTNSSENHIEVLFNENSESAETRDENLFIDTKEKNTNSSENQIKVLFNENSESAKTRDENLFVNTKEKNTNSSENYFDVLFNENSESVETRNENLFINTKEKNINSSENHIEVLFNENSESAETRDENLFVNTKEKNTNSSENYFEVLFNENSESAETRDENLFVNTKEKSTNSSENHIEALFNENSKPVRTTTAQLPVYATIPIVNQLNLQTVYYLPLGAENAKLNEILPKFDMNSQMYCKWLRTFIRKTKKLKYPLPLYKCQNIRHILDEITPAIAAYPTAFKGRPHHYYFMRLHKILSRMLTKQLKYVLSANEDPLK